MAKKKIRKANAAYSLPTLSGLKPETKRTLNMDPGSRNMGISVTALNPAGKFKVVANSLITNPLFDLTLFGSQREFFMAEVDAWIQLYKPDGIIIERFQTRGLQGPLIELVSIMIGLIAGRYPEIPIKLVTASTWKNDFARRHGPEALTELYKASRTTPHQLDSCFMGVYALEKGMRITIDYEIRDVVASAERSSLVRLINRKQS